MKLWVVVFFFMWHWAVKLFNLQWNFYQKIFFKFIYKKSKNQNPFCNADFVRNLIKKGPLVFLVFLSLIQSYCIGIQRFCSRHSEHYMTLQYTGSAMTKTRRPYFPKNTHSLYKESYDKSQIQINIYPALQVLGWFKGATHLHDL